MPFRSHTEGGDWLGGGRTVVHCNDAEQAAIRNGLVFKDSRVPRLRALGGLDRLADAMLTKTEATLEIDCHGPGCNSAVAGTGHARGENSFGFCPAGLPPQAPQFEVQNTVFHECIHACGGFEIDAWSLENHCCRDNGSHDPFDPGGIIHSSFRSETRNRITPDGLRYGEFVVWDPRTGAVFVKVESGGDWLTPPTISRGAPLNVNRSAYILR